MIFCFYVKTESMLIDAAFGTFGIFDEIDDFHIWSLDGIDSVMTLKVDVDFSKNVGEIKKEIYSIASKYHIVDITIEFD